MAAVLTAEDFLSVRIQYKNEQQPQEIPAAIEHLFPQGTMIDHYFVQPAPELLADPDVQALGGVSGFLFSQQADGPWLVQVHEITMVKEVCYEMADGEMQKLLAANHIVLPG